MRAKGLLYAVHVSTLNAIYGEKKGGNGAGPSGEGGKGLSGKKWQAIRCKDHCDPVWACCYFKIELEQQQ